MPASHKQVYVSLFVRGMNKNNFIKLFLNIVVLTFFLIYPLCTLAEGTLFVDGLNKGAASSGLTMDTNRANISVIVGKIIKGFIGFVGVLYLILVTYASLIWMTAAGDKNNTKRARGIFVHGAIGLIIVFLSYALVSFLFKQYQGALQ